MKFRKKLGVFILLSVATLGTANATPVRHHCVTHSSVLWVTLLSLRGDNLKGFVSPQHDDHWTMFSQPEKFHPRENVKFPEAGRSFARVAEKKEKIFDNAKILIPPTILTELMAAKVENSSQPAEERASETLAQAKESLVSFVCGNFSCNTREKLVRKKLCAFVDQQRALYSGSDLEVNGPTIQKKYQNLMSRLIHEFHQTRKELAKLKLDQNLDAQRTLADLIRSDSQADHQRAEKELFRLLFPRIQWKKHTAKSVSVQDKLPRQKQVDAMIANEGILLTDLQEEISDLEALLYSLEREETDLQNRLVNLNSDLTEARLYGPSVVQDTQKEIEETEKLLEENSSNRGAAHALLKKKDNELAHPTEVDFTPFPAGQKDSRKRMVQDSKKELFRRTIHAFVEANQNSSNDELSRNYQLLWTDLSPKERETEGFSKKYRSKARASLRDFANSDEEELADIRGPNKSSAPTPSAEVQGTKKTVRAREKAAQEATINLREGYDGSEDTTAWETASASDGSSAGTPPRPSTLGISDDESSTGTSTPPRSSTPTPVRNDDEDRYSSHSEGEEAHYELDVQGDTNDY